MSLYSGSKAWVPSHRPQKWARHRYVFLVSIPLFLWLALKNISLPDVLEALSGLGPLNITILAAVNVLMISAMTSRWWMITRALGYDVGCVSLAGYRTAANAVSYFTPGPQFGGEPLQVYWLHRIHKVPADASTLSVAMEKLIELTANFTFLLIGILFMVHVEMFRPFFAGGTVPICVLLFSGPAGILWAVLSGKRPFYRLSRLMERHRLFRGTAETSRFAKWIKTIRLNEERAETLFRQRPFIQIQAVLFSLLHWACILGESWLIFHFLGVTLTASQLIVTVTGARMAFLTPLPGGAGALEASQVLILTSFGLNPAVGLGAALVMRARDLIFGGVGLWLAGRFMGSAGK